MDKNYIKQLSQNIINSRFTSLNRRKIVEYADRINICCPYCGDGISEYKKRGNVYFNRLFYVCFNCDKKTTFDRFCKDHNQQIDPDKKLEMINHLSEVMTYSDYEDDFLDAKLDDLITINDLENVFKMNITPIFDFKPIVKGGGVDKYLVKRGIIDNLQNNIYQAKFWVSESSYQWVIVMLNRNKDKILGMQVRNLKSGRRRMFKIYNFENILEWVNLTRETPIDIDINKLVAYNKLSYYFNILNIDVNQKITIFEGYLDSLFYPNSIGLVGVNTDSKFLEKNELDIQYFFDNDLAGFKKSEEKIKSGYSVFLWNKLFDYIVEKKKPEDPHALRNRISKIKDINKLSELVKDPFINLKLYNFFSKDILDKKWLPKFRKIKTLNKNENETKIYDKKFNLFNNI